MKRSEFEKKQSDLQKSIINSIMDSASNFNADDCNQYGEHESGLNHKLLDDVSDVLENRKWNVVANAARSFTENGSEDLAGLFPGWEKEWLEICEIWAEHESGACSTWEEENE